MTSAFHAALEETLEENPGLAPALGEEAREALAVYWELLSRWNVVHNLTRRQDVRAFLREDVADCALGLACVREASPVIDVGSGAGFPGLLAALVWPKAEVHLVEALRKRFSFLRRVARELGLRRVVVHGGRAEELGLRGERVLTRATLPWTALGALQDRVAPGGALVAFVGAEPDVEQWRALVEKWGWRGVRRDYRVSGLGPRGVAVAVRPSGRRNEAPVEQVLRE